MAFQTRGTTKELAALLPVCVCTYAFEDEGRNSSGKCMPGTLGCCHIFRSLKATKTSFYSKHAQRDNSRQGEDWQTVSLCLVLV